MMSNMPDELRNILIMKPSSLGDIVMALPALSALRKTFSSASISWLVRPEFAPLLKVHPFVDHVIIFDRRILGKAWRSPKAFTELVSLVRTLRKQKFDAIIDLQGLFRTGVLAWLSGCKRRYGMDQARELAHIFYTTNVAADAGKPHMVDYYLKIAAAAGASEGNVEFVFGNDRRSSGSFDNLLKQHGLLEAPYAVLIPGSAHADKCWPAENFAAIADRIEAFGLRVVLTGTNAERQIVERVRAAAKTNITDLAGRTGLVELVELLRHAAVVVANDTGPGHIAAALGIPAVLVYGCSNPTRVGPYTPNACAVAIEPDARGRKFKSNDPRYDIRKVGVDQVYEKVRHHLVHLKSAAT
jgi:lipopolysaccharide heptosyltransferase I